jgi:hypothetical protein
MYCNRCKDKNFLIASACGCGVITTLRSKQRKGRRYMLGHQLCRLRRYKKWNGYWMVRRPNHLFANQNGYVLEHRLVHEEYHKCCLLPWTIVHHKDGDKENNDPSNLEPMLINHHNRLHNIGRQHTIPGTRVCMDCGSKTTYHRPRSGYPEWRRVDNAQWRCKRCDDKACRKSKLMPSKIQDLNG